MSALPTELYADGERRKQELRRTLSSGSRERVRLGALDDIEQLLAEKDVRVGCSASLPNLSKERLPDLCTVLCATNPKLDCVVVDTA